MSQAWLITPKRLQSEPKEILGKGKNECEGKTRSGIGVCDDDGQVICEEGEVRKRWRDCLATLLQSNDQPQHCTALYCTVLHCTVLYCTVLYCTALYCTALYCTVLHCTALYYTVLHCTVLHCTVLHCTALYCTVLYCTGTRNSCVLV